MAKKTKVRWDLTSLYDSMDDPRIEQTLQDGLRRAQEFAERYRGRINSDELAAQTLFEAVRDFESLQQDVDKPAYYASLLFSTDTSDPARGAFLQKIRERATEISVHLIFFEVELLEAPEERISVLLDDPILAQYKHFIKSTRLFREHHLSEPEERLMEEKANTGSRAFSRLFEETVSNIPFKVEHDGETEVVTEPEVLALLRNPKREIRRAAAGSLTEGLQSNSRTLTFIFNTLVQDKAVNDRLRRYSFPEQARHLSNELDPEIVELVVGTAEDNYDLVARYYRLKRKILGLDKLTHYDRYAPLFETRKEVPYERAKEIILQSFGAFSDVIAERAAEFFDKNWIDAEVRKGKRGGAFCSYITPDLHPYVFVNYLNRMDDVKTLGHELGHGVHASLSRGQTYVNFHGTLPLAELASTFGEMLVFDSLVGDADLDDKMALYAEKIEDVFATVFRQAAMYRFEQDLHNARRQGGEQTTDQISEIWQRRIQSMFLDSVELGDEHKYWWLYVGHFIESPFYVYAYSFGELLVMALYAKYQRELEAFPPKYIEMLRAGGSMSPHDLLSHVDIDIKQREFWQGGLNVIRGIIERFEEIHGEWIDKKLEVRS
ncbi:MAG: M3 family oligoendopeptidase [Armatimonadota bacterium]|nr:M3 family oligoendopeptidase [Armatimonadota bacterium]